MNISKFDLNLLVFLDVLLQECNVTRAANRLGVTQSAMSNRLKKIRQLLNDPVLVRTSEGLQPTKKVLALQPVVRKLINTVENSFSHHQRTDIRNSSRVFRIMASDYVASVLLPPLLSLLKRQAPKVSLDIISPSDTTFHIIENGQVDLAINLFTREPNSFHQQVLWKDYFCMVMRKGNRRKKNITLEQYFDSKHVWVSKSDYGVGAGMTHEDVRKFKWIDGSINNLGLQRNIKIFTRSYHVALRLAQQQNLIATLPYRAALLKKHDSELSICPLPFETEPFTIKMIWSPVLQHDSSHKWFRKMVKLTADQI